MRLSDYKFKPDYNKIDNDISKEFYLPAMGSSCNYDRISGYFGSTIYIIAWSALQKFVKNGGKMRLICSPVISEVDKKAITEGYSAKNNQIILKSLDNELEKLFSSDNLEKPARVLACLIANNIMNIKIAIPKTGSEPDVRRLFHDKVGIFTDADGNSVGFRGSMNETFQGLSDDGNLESIDVFPSWTDARDASRVASSIQYFQRLWDGKEQHVQVYEFPEAVRKKLIEKSNGYDWEQLTKEISTSISLSKKWSSDKRNNNKHPRTHQIEALENWTKNDRQGILKHATGSGKTYTAICAIRDALNRGQTVLVLVPSKELLRQWKKEIVNNISDIKVEFLLCGDGNNDWKKENRLQIWTRKNDSLNKITIATMDTACSDEFIKNVSDGQHLLMVADEVHRIGSPVRRKVLKINAGERLGLSATPIRFGDPEGTQAIFDYFKGIVKPVFSLEDAIKANVLTKYYYYPQEVHLSEDEQERWLELTREINKIIAISGESGESFSKIINNNTKLKMKMIARARILKQASAKVPLALKVIKEHFEDGQRWIVYCDDQNQLTAVLKLLLTNGYDAFEYYSDMQGDREQTLKYFSENGGILVSIRCLDEGVDIPSATNALILASSKNPREFIQRRGRILRKFPGKPFAELYDAIVVPELSFEESNMTNSIIEAELSRAIQFGEWAENPTCIADLKIIARSYGIDYENVRNEGIEDED